MAQTPPSGLESYQRGQVAHIVRSAIGAKEFADSVPPAPADWICVFDRTCRTGEKFEAPSWDREAEPFDPQLAFGLDDDPPRWLCCTNLVRDSSRESSVVAGGHEQTHTPRLQDPELARLITTQPSSAAVRCRSGSIPP